MSDRIEDGVVCESAWKNAKVRVFHLMKEKTRDLDSNFETLGQLFVNKLRNGGHRGGIAYKLAARTLAIRDGWEGKERSFEEIEEMVEDRSNELADVLEATAIANMIKDTTSERTSDERLDKNCGSLWIEQIQNAKPHVVLCAGPGLFNIVWNYFSKEREEGKDRPRRGASRRTWGLSWEKTPTGLDYFLHNGCVYLQFYHPSHYGKKQKELHGLLAGSMETVRRAFEDKKILKREGGRLVK